jgi:tRNA(Ser,Leu) C12 N-acetylase TAN1
MPHHRRPGGEPPKIAWNVVATCHGEGFRDAIRLLGRHGEVARTGYHNLLVARVPEPMAFAETLAAEMQAEPGLANFLSRVVPVEQAFDFTDAGALDRQLVAALASFLPRLAGRSFHVRAHRRGLKEELSGHLIEQQLGRSLLDALAAAGAPGKAEFADPDQILAVEIVDHRAGLSLWSREQRARMPFLKLD